MDNVFSDLPLFVYPVVVAMVIISVFSPRVRELLENSSSKLRVKQKARGKYTLPLIYSPKLYKTAAIFFLIFLAAVLALPNSLESINSILFSVVLAMMMSCYLLVHDSFRLNLSIRIRNDSLSLNDKDFPSSSIDVIELWDDLILIRHSGKNEEKYWLRFNIKNHSRAVEIMEVIQQFCSDHNIALENHFALNIKDNEIFNPPYRKILS